MAKVKESDLIRLAELFRAESEAQRRRFAPITEAFIRQAATPGSLFESARIGAMGLAEQLFAPRGEIASLIQRARGQVIGQGFAPEAAVGAENAILRRAVEQVGQTLAQQAAGLESTRFGGLAAALGEAEQGQRDLLESLFTGYASAAQLGLAKRGFLKRIFGGG